MRLRIVCHTLLSGAALALVAGCAATTRQTTLPEPRPLGAQYATTGRDAPGGREDQQSPIEPTETLALRQALALALLRNPDLAAFSHDVRAAEARTLQARLLPNPELELEVEEYDRDGEGFDSAEAALVLGQLFELGGKRRRRARVAEVESELAGWDYESKRLDVFTLTARRFVAVIAAQRRLELDRSTVELAEKTSQAVAERVTAGKEPPLQASKAAAELEMARMGVLDAENDLDVSKTRLAAMWGAAQPNFQAVHGDLDNVLESLPTMEVLRSRLSSNPDLARWNAELRLRKAVLSSEKAARMPDLEASLGLQRFEEDGTDSLSFGIGLPLPLFDRNQGNIAAAMHDLAKAEAERKAAETARAAELVEAYADLTSAHGRALTLRARVVPAMQETFDAAHEGYRQGKFGFLDMLDAQRGLFEANGALVDALSDYHTAVAEIQRITGTSIEELLENKVEEKK